MRPSILSDHLIERSSTLLQHLPGAATDEIQNIRSSGLARFIEIGLPTLRHEAWRYTNIQPLSRLAFEPVEKPKTKLTVADIDQLGLDTMDTTRIVLLDGWLIEHLSNTDAANDQIQIVSLAQVLSGEQDISPTLYEFVTSRLQERANRGSDGFATLNSALVADGVIVYVKEGAQLAKPLEILCISTGSASHRLNNINNFVLAESGSKLSIVERYVSIVESDHLTNSSLTFRLGSNSIVDHYRIQNESERAFHVGSSKINQAEKSQYRIYSLSFGALLDRHEVVESLDGEQSHCELKGLYLGSGKQHIDNYTTVAHASPNCTSDEFYKGILNDRSRSVFHGRIRVDIDSQNTDAQQQNKNLLLSKYAEANTKPQLEIYADDVKCSHGATVGQLDENAVFYIRTRGMSERQARAILTRAFATEIVQKIEIDALQDYIENLVQEKLGFGLQRRKVA